MYIKTTENSLNNSDFYNSITYISSAFLKHLMFFPGNKSKFSCDLEATKLFGDEVATGNLSLGWEGDRKSCYRICYMLKSVNLSKCRVFSYVSYFHNTLLLVKSF